jgi:DNA polymerase-3 subunit alpha
MHHSDFVHLHLHSQYSLLDGAIRPKALLEAAKGYKMPAVAVTDHGNLFGAVDFYELAMKSGVKPIIGCETYVAPGSMRDRTPPVRGATNAYHLVLLVKNATGYRNLCKLLSKAYIDGFYYKPRIDKELLAEHNEGLIALSACLHGEVSYNLNMGRMEAAAEAAGQYKEIFDKNRFYLELQHNGMEVQEKVNASMIELGRKLDIPLVATNDCHYLKKEDAKTHDILLCIQTGTTVNAENRMRFATEEFYLKSPDEMIEAFKDTPEAISNTIAIAERCNLELELGTPHLPNFPVPKGETLDAMMEAAAKQGLAGRLKTLKEKGAEYNELDYHERLTKELKVINGMGFAGYFMIVTDFINYAKGRDIPVGPGRGSAAGSLVAYSLGITNIDPIRYNLLFERFLNPDRISLPDIDIDFCFERRDEVIRYVTEKYGPENVTQIITFGQMKARACLRDVGRVLDMPYGDVDKIAKLVPAQLNITIEQALAQEPKLKAMVKNDARVAELISVARALEGLPRHASTHAAGVVISNKPLVEYLPLYKGSKENIITTQYPMKDVESIGLVKFDFLGLKTLTVIDRTLKIIERNGGEKIDLDSVSSDDPAAYKLIAASNTSGVFQLESSGMRELLRKLKPNCFEDLIAAVALYRPGPLQSGMVDDFIKRRHGSTAVKFEIPQLKAILENTYGVMVYQEQVMEIAKVLASFTPGDADKLRKAMGKKLADQMVVQRTKFLDGAAGNGISKARAERIFDLMAKFAGYGFNKSHSAAYALIAFQTAYLKAHYPVEFMASLLSSDMDNTDSVVKYINECRDMGIEVAPPDLNESSKKFTVSGSVIRFGLAAVKNVGAAAIDTIIAERENGPYTDVADFLVRIDSRKVNKKVVESLVKCGAFDFTGQAGLDRGLVAAALPQYMDEAAKRQTDRDNGQGSFFDILAPSSGSPGSAAGGVRQMAMPADASPWCEAELLAAEKETLGFYFSSHPLNSYSTQIEAYTNSSIEGLRNFSNRDTVTVAGITTACKVIVTKKGAQMAFVTLEDLGANVEVVVFSDLYKDASELIASETPLIVVGRLDKDGDEVKIVATDIAALDEAEKLLGKLRVKRAHIYLDGPALKEGQLRELKETLRSNPGVSPVFLHLNYPGDREVVISTSEDFRISPAPETLESLKLLGMDITFK